MSVQPLSKIFAEDNPPSALQSAHQGTAQYLDPGYINVKIVFDLITPSVPLLTDFKGRVGPLPSRESLLIHEVGLRLISREKQRLPDSERYLGWQLTRIQKMKRIFGINVDLEIQSHKKNLLKPGYTAKNVSHFDVHIHPSPDLCRRLKLNPEETSKLRTRSEWCYNGSMNGHQYFDKEGELITLHSSVTSSNDRSSDQICMMRRYKDYETQATLGYTGRPDTKSKAIEQIEFIFRNEIAKPHSPKGITQNTDGSYTLTYLVNNLMSPITGIGFFTFDEKKAILSEQKILNQLEQETLIIDGKKVHVKPLYFSEPINQSTLYEKILTDAHSGRGVATQINKLGYQSLIPLAEKQLAKMNSGPEKELLEAAIRTLKNEKTALLPEEALFNRAIIAHFLNLPIVNHCKSSTDRTIIAMALGAIAFQWNKLRLDYQKDENGHLIPHSILQDERAKELFAGHAFGGHQVTRVSRTSEEVGTRIMGYDWSSNPVAARLMPERYSKENAASMLKTLKTCALIGLAFFINLALLIPIFLIGSLMTRTLFNPFFIKPTGLPFAKRKIDASSPYIGRGEGRSLLKPKGMIKL